MRGIQQQADALTSNLVTRMAACCCCHTLASKPTAGALHQGTRVSALQTLLRHLGGRTWESALAVHAQGEWGRG